MLRMSPDFARLSFSQRIGLALAVGGVTFAAAGCAANSTGGNQNGAPTAANPTVTLRPDCSKPYVAISDSVAAQVSDAWTNGGHEKPDPSLLKAADPSDFRTLQNIGDFSFMQVVIFDGATGEAPTAKEQSTAYDLGQSLGITSIDIGGDIGWLSGQGGVKNPVAAHTIALMLTDNALERVCDGAKVY